MKALKTQDTAGNTYYVKCASFLITNSTVNVCMYQDPYHVHGSDRKFFKDFAHLNEWLKRNPTYHMLGKPTFSTGNKPGNSRDNHVYNFEN